MSSPVWIMCDLAIESVTFIIVIKNWFGLGFGGPEIFYDGFKTSRGVICDVQYLKKFEIVIDTVL